MLNVSQVVTSAPDIIIPATQRAVWGGRASVCGLVAATGNLHYASDALEPVAAGGHPYIGKQLLKADISAFFKLWTKLSISKS